MSITYVVRSRPAEGLIDRLRPRHFVMRVESLPEAADGSKRFRVTPVGLHFTQASANMSVMRRSER